MKIKDLLCINMSLFKMVEVKEECKVYVYKMCV